MIILISGTTHTGKTLIAQKLLEKYHYPYLSIDHLKMGLIRSEYCKLTPDSPDDQLTAYLWPIIREIIKTNIENKQHLIIEGCYIPNDYKKDFDDQYLSHIKYVCLIFSERYINEHYHSIVDYENQIEARFSGDYLNKTELIKANMENLNNCLEHHCEYILIDDEYTVEKEMLRLLSDM